MFVRVVKWAVKTIIVMMIVFICAWAALVFIGLYLSPPTTRDTDYKQPVDSKAPVMLYVGTHSFKMPADYWSAPIDNASAPGDEELILYFYYPDFVPPYDDPRFIADEGTPRIDDDKVEIHIYSGDNSVSPGTRELQAIKAGTTTDWLTPAPYQLRKVNYKGHPDWRDEYIGSFDGNDVDITCGDPSILQDGVSIDDLCLAYYAYNDLSIQEGFSVPNLKHWKDIVQRTLHFLTIHEVK
jgi:hypothetical protein